MGHAGFKLILTYEFWGLGTGIYDDTNTVFLLGIYTYLKVHKCLQLSISTYILAYNKIIKIRQKSNILYVVLIVKYCNLMR